MTPEEQQKQLHSLLRESLSPFIRKVFHEINPGKPFVDSWYLDAIAHRLERCRIGLCKRLIITAPPRSLKSLLTSVAYPAFLLDRNPAQRILGISYANELALKHARDFRYVVDSSWYRQVFPHTVAHRNVEDIFETTRRGFRRSGSFAGGETGLGANTIIVDDAMKSDDALQKSVREKANDYFANTLYSRLDRKTDGVIIVIMQRLHDEDLVGYLLRQRGWDHLNLPAIAAQDDSNREWSILSSTEGRSSQSCIRTVVILGRNQADDRQRAFPNTVRPVSGSRDWQSYSTELDPVF
jgi:hypothetical protein